MVNVVDLAGFRLQKATLPRRGDCLHRHVVIDERQAEVECGDCHVKLNPLWVLNQLASQVGQHKCRHCGEIL